MMKGHGNYMPPAGGNPGVAVVGPQFMVPYPIDLTIQRKMLTLSEGNFNVTDSNGTLMFSIKGRLLSLRDRRVLLDVYGNPVVSLQQKVYMFYIHCFCLNFKLCMRFAILSLTIVCIWESWAYLLTSSHVLGLIFIPRFIRTDAKLQGI